MKRLVTLLVTALLMTAALCVSASAADYQSAAEDLSAIGMFRGTVNGGFELDRAPKRSEAAIMLVRLYGAEEEAAAAYQSGEISHPFKDVGPIASPYVAWLYTKGITKGATATTFNSNAACTDKNYVVFLLRALGYEDGKDFQYADSLTFAEKLGFYQADYFEGPFLRDDLAAITLQALATDKKGGETYLLKSLIDTGAVDATKAKNLTEKIENYRALTRATDAVDSVSQDTNSLTQARGTVQYVGDTMDVSFDSSTREKIVLRNGKVQLSSETKITQNGETTESGTWIKDGWLYIYTKDGGVTAKNKVAVDDSMTDADLAEVESNQVDKVGLSAIKSISVVKDGLTSYYSVDVDASAAAFLSGILENYVDEDDKDLTSIEVSDIKVTYTVNGQDVLGAMTTSFRLKIVYASGEFQGDPMVMDMKYTVASNILATGNAVSITFPDFSDYVILN